jgi:hypothetical protein
MDTHQTNKFVNQYSQPLYGRSGGSGDRDHSTLEGGRACGMVAGIWVDALLKNIGNTFVTLHPYRARLDNLYSLQ